MASTPAYEFQIPAHARQSYPGSLGRGSVYARVSGESDTKTASMETQAQGEIDALVAAGFWLTPQDVLFERYSGVESLAFREVLLELRDLAEDGYYQAVAFHDPDRLVRGMEVVQVVHELEEAGCQVFFNGILSEPSDERDLLLMVGGYASKKEAKQIRERTTRVRASITDKGEWFGAGPIRYGLRFDKETRRRAREPDLAAVVFRIFELIAGGASTVHVARTLNAEGVPSPFATLKTARAKARTTLWTPEAIRRIIREESYLGKAYINRYRYLRDHRGRIVKKGRKKVRVAVPRAEWVEIAHGQTDRIVPDDLWDRANAALTGARTRQGKIDATRQEQHFYLLRGIIHCGECRRRMHCSYRHSGAGKSRFDLYECKTRYTDYHGHGPCRGHSVGAAKVERLLRPILDALITDPAFVASSLDLAFREDEAANKLRREAARTAEALDRLDRQIRAYTGDLRDPDLGERSRQAIRAQMHLIEEQIGALERNRQEVDAQLVAVSDRGWLRERYQERCEEVRRSVAAKGDLGPADYRLFMEGFGLKVYYRKGELEVECQPGVILEDKSVLTVAARSRTRLSRNVTVDLPPIRLDLGALAG